MKRRIIPVVLLLLFTNAVFAVKMVRLPGLMKPLSIAVDADDYVIVDGITVCVYSLKTHKLKTKFGEKGEGPGEFKMPPNVMLLPDSIFADTFDKAAWFSKEGKLLKEVKKTGFMTFIPFKEKMIGEQFIPDFKKHRISAAVNLLNSKLEKVKTIYNTQIDVSMDMSFFKGDEEWKMLHHYYKLDGDWEKGRIFIADSRKGFFIAVFDENGKELYTIDKPVQQIEVTADYKKKALEKLKIEKKAVWERIKNRNFTFYKYFPPIKSFNVADGKLYVATYKIEKNKMEFVVLDLKGNLLKNVFLPIKNPEDMNRENFYYSICSGKLYHLVENEDSEEWELHIHDI